MAVSIEAIEQARYDLEDIMTQHKDVVETIGSTAMLRLFVPDKASEVLGTTYSLATHEGEKLPSGLHVVSGSSVEYCATNYALSSEGLTISTRVGIADLETSGPVEREVNPIVLDNDYEFGKFIGGCLIDLQSV